MKQTPFEISLQRREREVELLWTRSNTYWVIISLCFTAYWTVADSPLRGLFISSIGLLSGISWALTISGTKWWQEYWEQKMRECNIHDYENILNEEKIETAGFSLFTARRYSVSKILFTIASFFILIWAALAVRGIFKVYSISTPCANCFGIMLPAIFLMLVFGFIVILLAFTQGKKK